MECGAYIPAGGEADVTFSFVSEYGGTVVFSVSDCNGQYVGKMPLEQFSDTLADYNPYLENKSYLSRDGDQWYWNVELADRIGVEMPHGIPSDDLYLRVRHSLNDEHLKSIRETTGLKEYLAALPDNIGTGTYTFTYQMPVEVGKPGEYYFDSFLAEIVNEEVVSYCCSKTYRFTIDDITGIEDVTTDNGQQTTNTWYTIHGVKLSGKPTRPGLYIQGNKKIYIR